MKLNEKYARLILKFQKVMNSLIITMRFFHVERIIVNSYPRQKCDKSFDHKRNLKRHIQSECGENYCKWRPPTVGETRWAVL